MRKYDYYAGTSYENTEPKVNSPFYGSDVKEKEYNDAILNDYYDYCFEVEQNSWDDLINDSIYY